MTIKDANRYNVIVTRSAAILFLLGLLTGIYVTMVATGKIEGNIGASLAAHLNGIIGAMILLSLILILPGIKYGHGYKRAMILMFIISNYANWLITLIKSFLQVEGIAIVYNSLSNNIIHVALVILVVIPALTGGTMWAFGIGARQHQVNNVAEDHL
ncbi:hypothetical protein [Ekhidna sp.]|uniref:hypothetical protein n=1 Tax=Ekhidna sp. TaxID=2608089 RepID=UPI0032988C28